MLENRMIRLQKQNQPVLLQRSKIHLGVIGVHNLSTPHSIPFCFISIGNVQDGIVPEIDLARHLTFTQIISKSANI